MKLSKKAVIFDFDETLNDNPESFRRSYRAMCRRYPTCFVESDAEMLDRFKHFYGHANAKKIYEEICRHVPTPEVLPPLHGFNAEWVYNYCSSAVPLPDSISTIDYLHANGYKVGLLTNGVSDRQWRKIRSSGLYPYFDSIVVSGDLPFEKPDPAIYRLSLEELGVTVDEAIFVGDCIETDINGANNVGMDSLWITNETENRANATYLAPSVAFLKTIL